MDQESEIASFVRVLVTHPDCVKVRKTRTMPPTFEITAHKKDIPDLVSKKLAIEVFGGPPKPELIFVEAPETE